MTGASWEKERQRKIRLLEDEWTEHERAIEKIKVKIGELEAQDLDEARADVRAEVRKQERENS